MARVRFYYDVYVDEDDIVENREYESEEEITEDDIIDRARTLFEYDIQDRAVHVNELECDVMERQNSCLMEG